MKQAIAAIDEDAWVDIDYTLGGQAQVAETIYTAGRGTKTRSVRLVVRRTRLTEPAQRRLWPDWRHHAFITSDTNIDMIEADRFHREHATVELAIRDLKEGAGLDHIPSGHYHANAAWLACAVLAHNLGMLGRPARRAATHHTPNPTHTAHRTRRGDREPIRSTGHALPGPMAMGPRVQHFTQSPPGTASTFRLNCDPAAGAPQNPPQR